MSSRLDKQLVIDVVGALPDDATWDDFYEEIEVHAKIERALADVAAGRVTEVSDVRRKYGLPA